MFVLGGLAISERAAVSGRIQVPIHCFQEALSYEMSGLISQLGAGTLNIGEGMPDITFAKVAMTHSNR